MKHEIIERAWALDEKTLETVWEKLCRRETFVDGQIFPYRVEFVAKQQRGRFAPGELNIHHGPLLSVHGAIGDVTEDYRDLRYFFGSYVLSFRWVRPTRLQFFKGPGLLRLQLDAYVAPWFAPFWRLGNSIFWRFFGISFLWKKKPIKNPTKTS